MAQKKLHRPSLPPAKKMPAVVLSRASRGDSDLVVTFLTGEKGLITGLAKNARQSVRRFGGNLLRPGTAAWYHVRQKPGRDLAFVERGEINPKAPVLPSDPICLALVSWSLELVRAFEAHENPAQKSFNLLVRYLMALSKLTDFKPPALEARRLSIIFTKSYLKLAGFAPIVDQCFICRDHDSTNWWWDAVLGGVICQKCLSKRGLGPTKMSQELIGALRMTYGRPSLSNLNEKEILSAENFFRTIATLQSGRRFKSVKVFYELLQKT
ncbi:MAG: DNA repair protein RecO [Deltaproteobacteria bacterium]|jgi:DNA repair protein RecO (recombination protein O)|nr:DNA repair protein RecO [Deltaproteobacteria bacterium]